jgi:SAM-dependent methyltransferase
MAGKLRLQFHLQPSGDLGVSAQNASDSPRRIKGNKSLLAVFFSVVWWLSSLVALAVVVLVAAFYPRKTDAPLTVQETAGLEDYYAKAYRQVSTPPAEEENSDYVRIAAQAAEALNVKGRVESLVQKYDLQGRRVLDAGAGRGYLQDRVDDSVGLDISPSARRFFRKPFIHGSATHMPRRDGEFDAAWSVWVLEHVPNPEAALVEIRRVVRDGGVLFLMPAWDCIPWAGEGYPVRPYSDFNVGGKIIKAAYPPELALRAATRGPVRFVRRTAHRIAGEPTRLRYHAMQPNSSSSGWRIAMLSTRWTRTRWRSGSPVAAMNASAATADWENPRWRMGPSSFESASTARTIASRQTSSGKWQAH